MTFTALLFTVLIHSQCVSAADLKSFYQTMQTAKTTTFLLDVREPSEAAESGMAEGAKLVPTSDIDADGPLWQTLLSDLSKAKPSGHLKIGVYCRSGKRAGRIVHVLEGKGFKAENLGGFSDWQAEKLPTVPYKP